MSQKQDTKRIRKDINGDLRYDINEIIAEREKLISETASHIQDFTLDQISKMLSKLDAESFAVLNYAIQYTKTFRTRCSDVNCFSYGCRGPQTHMI